MSAEALAATAGRARVLDLMTSLLAELFERDVERMDVNTRFNDDLGMDSLHILALVAELEERLDVVIDVQEIADIATVGQALDLVEAAMATAENGA